MTSVKHRIELTDTTPFKQKHRRIPPALIQEVRNHLQPLLSAGVISKSHSPWASNIILCRKKDQSIRMCIDYRQLNQRTIKDSYALPRIKEILDSLGGNCYFTVLDMKSGYHQVEINEAHKERTAFTVGPLGFYEFNRLPFGLANAPASYQRLMEECLGDLNMKICFIYLDDLIIFSKTFDEHMDHLEMVFQRLQEANLKLSTKKCVFLKKKVKFVGHIVSEDGIEPDPDKVEVVLNWPKPDNPEKVCQFLGFIGYYRKFIKNFSKIARPLIDLMPVPEKKRKKRNKTTTSEFKWGVEQDTAFQKLKELVSSEPILGFPDYSKQLHTDASGSGLGAILYQEQDGVKRVIAYASRALNKSEKNYPAHKLEFLALKWSVCDKFNDYLLGHRFTVLTDNNPLTYVLSSAKLDATGQRWVAALAAFDFDILYRPGNADADSLSRLPGAKESISLEAVSAICNIIHAQPHIYSLSTNDELKEPQVPQVKIKEIQENDLIIQEWKQNIVNKRKPNRATLRYKPAHRWFHDNYDKFEIKGGVLFRNAIISGNTRQQIILPLSQVTSVLHSLHNDMGHPGRERTSSLVKDRFAWYGMTRDIDDYIQRCTRCLHRKTPTCNKAPLSNIKTSQPLELVCMDYLTLEKCKGGYEHILVITDHFTRYAVAVPTRNMTAKTTAEAFVNNFIVHYGIPKRIHSDQGANFESQLIKDLCNTLNMEKSGTTPYHPMGNGLCQRFNRTLLNMLGTLNSKQKEDWKTHVTSMVHAYNCTKQDTTGYSPYYIMFGREPRLPIDLIYDTATKEVPQSHSKYIKTLHEAIEKSYEKINKSVNDAQAKQKKRYDTKARSATLDIGDRVMVKIVAFDGKHKIADKWEEDFYRITSQPNVNIPVYTVENEDGTGRKRTLHRNLLFPIGQTDEENREQKTIPKIKPRKRRSQIPKQIIEPPPSQIQEQKDDNQDVNDEDSEILLIASRVNPDVSDTTEDENKENDESSTIEGTETSSATTELESIEETVTLSDMTDDQDRNDEPVPAPRRSTRVRNKPKWFSTEQYVMSQQMPNPDWMLRANYLKSAYSSGVFAGIENEIPKTLLKIISDVT